MLSARSEAMVVNGKLAPAKRLQQSSICLPSEDSRNQDVARCRKELSQIEPSHHFCGTHVLAALASPARDGHKNVLPLRTLKSAKRFVSGFYATLFDPEYPKRSAARPALGNDRNSTDVWKPLVSCRQVDIIGDDIARTLRLTARRAVSSLS